MKLNSRIPLFSFLLILIFTSGCHRVPSEESSPTPGDFLKTPISTTSPTEAIIAHTALPPANGATVHSLTPSIQFTETSEAPDVDELGLFSDCPMVDYREYSPKGDWVVIYCVGGVEGIYQKDDPSRHWQLSYHDDYEAKFSHYEGFSGWLNPKYWSIDGEYVYFVARPANIDGGCPIYDPEQAIIRLNLESGEVSYPFAPGFNQFYYFSFSPNGKYLIIFTNHAQATALTQLDLISGAERQIPLPNSISAAGNFIWSQDMNQGIFSARTSTDCANLTFALVLIDLDTFESQILINGLDTVQIPTEWKPGTNQITVKGYDPSTYTDINSSFDISTKSFSP